MKITRHRLIVGHLLIFFIVSKNSVVQLVQLVHCPPGRASTGFAEPTFAILCWFSGFLLVHCLPEKIPFKTCWFKTAFVGSVLVQNENKNLIKQ
jgi:hypothetical protein